MQKERPISPHLTIYRPQLTAMLSFAHRSTGVFLALGTPFLVLWLMSIAAGPSAYTEMQECLSHWFAKLLLLGWTFSLFYHLCNGIRHLFWDAGKGFELTTLYKSGWLVVACATLLTAATFITAVSGGGAS